MWILPTPCTVLGYRLKLEIVTFDQHLQTMKNTILSFKCKLHMYETNLCFFNPSHKPFQMCYLLDVEGHLYAKHIIQSYCDTCLFDVCSSLQALHIPLKYRCPIKKGDHRMSTYRNPFKYGRHTYFLPPPPSPIFDT